jgi:hypothetical protein
MPRAWISILALLIFCSSAFSQTPKDSTRAKKLIDPAVRRVDSLKHALTRSLSDTGATTGKPDAQKDRSSTTRTVERQTAMHAEKNAPRVKNAGPTNK